MMPQLFAARWVLRSPCSSKRVHRSFSTGSVLVSFKNVSFEYLHGKPILQDANFTIREGNKVTIMGQNGSGKSSITKLINGSLLPQSGTVNVKPGLAVATAMQIMPRDCLDLTVKDFFIKAAHDNERGIDVRIANVLQQVKLHAPNDRIIRSFSGGQQARLLLASALILEPDIIMLDEPTNNLDASGIDVLTVIIHTVAKTCVVISHDEDFLNSFTDSVLYLDIHSKKVEQYDGDYHTVKSEIIQRIKRENSINARLLKEAQAKKDQANAFANKVYCC
jgi:ATPase subunit of ABC transporter with duplicated ATPase domains